MNNAERTTHDLSAPAPKSNSTTRNLAGCEGTPGQGPFMLFVLKVSADDRIEDARFQTYGCPAAQAFGDFVCNWLCGKTLAEAGALTTGDLIAAVGQPPLGREHTPGLAVNALRKALDSDGAV